MRKVLCKIFSFLLNVAKQVVELVADTLVYIGTAAVEVLSALAGAVGSSIMKSPLGFVVLAVGAVWLLGFLGSSDDDSKPEGEEATGVVNL